MSSGNRQPFYPGLDVLIYSLWAAFYQHLTLVLTYTALVNVFTVNKVPFKYHYQTVDVEAVITGGWVVLKSGWRVGIVV